MSECAGLAGSSRRLLRRQLLPDMAVIAGDDCPPEMPDEVILPLIRTASEAIVLTYTTQSSLNPGSLRAEVDEEAWARLYSTTSRPFPRPTTGKIAVKVINDYGDELLKVYEV